MYDFGWRKTVKIGGRGIAVGANIATEQQLSQLQIFGQFLGHRDHVEGVAGGAKHRAYLGMITGFKRFNAVAAVVENNARIGVVNAIIDIVA